MLSMHLNASNRFNALHTSLDGIDIRLRQFRDLVEQGHTTAAELTIGQAKAMRELITKISENSKNEIKLHFTSELKSSERMTQMHLEKATDDSVHKISGALNELNLATQSDQERRRLLGSLKFDRMNDRRNQVVKSYGKTCHWVLESHHGSKHDSEGVDDDGDDLYIKQPLNAKWDSFVEWLRSDNKVYWISGKPGTGKTTLVKYILQEARTKAALNHWNNNHLVISHFFWRPGTSMQQNIKGMLCSILYQLFQSSDEMVGKVLTSYEIDRKDCDSDWSEDELQSLCLDVMRQYSKAICLFLDGLDEVDPKDGVIKLLGTIELLQAAGTVKMCLTGRPETLLQLHLEQYPTLRLQDLNESDLFEYANQNILISSSDAIISGSTRHNLIRRLVSKADGVFLWLHLVVSNINRGLKLGDGPEDMERRIDSLPNGLLELYKDMWARLNDDQDVYRQQAAHYFRLVSVRAGYHVFYNPFLTHPFFMLNGINPLQMMLQTTGISRQILDQTVPIPTVQQLSDLCQTTIRHVQTRTAGLLQLSEEYGLLNTPVEMKDNLALISREFQFIHSTAEEFLFDTLEGQEILKAYSTPPKEFILMYIEACLAAQRMFPKPANFPLQSILELYRLLRSQP